MKTSTNEVTCDGCGGVIPAMTSSALFLTIRGPSIGHKKVDFHDRACFAVWVARWEDELK